MNARCTFCAPDTQSKTVEVCADCRTPLCPAHAHYYVDESNAAITKSSPCKCAECAGLLWQVVRWSETGDESVADYRTPEAARHHAATLNVAYQTTLYTIRRKNVAPAGGAA